MDPSEKNEKELIILSSSSSSESESSESKVSDIPPLPLTKATGDCEALPPKKYDSSLPRWLDCKLLSFSSCQSPTRLIIVTFFSAYRRTFSIIFIANLTAFIVLVARNKGTPRAPDVGSAASANLMVCILFRQENFVNIVYEIACCVPHSWPLSIRKRLALVFHYGGMHSGAGVAAVVWYILYTAIVTIDFITFRNAAAMANMITSYVLVLMFCLILAGAHPRFRVRYHDYFEALRMYTFSSSASVVLTIHHQTDRYAGWIALTTFWIHTIFAGNEYRAQETPVPSLGKYLISTPNFWTLCISTSCSLLSWSRLRRQDVHPEVLSDHAIRLHFKYRNMKPFYGLKVSTKPLLEWHAFATIPDEDEHGKPNGFSVVVSNAGDWTKNAIMSPPKKLWLRGSPLHGLLYTSHLFKKIVLVATGSGIGSKHVL